MKRGRNSEVADRKEAKIFLQLVIFPYVFNIISYAKCYTTE